MALCRVALRVGQLWQRVEVETHSGEALRGHLPGVAEQPEARDVCYSVDARTLQCPACPVVQLHHRLQRGLKIGFFDGIISMRGGNQAGAERFAEPRLNSS